MDLLTISYLKLILLESENVSRKNLVFNILAVSKILSFVERYPLNCACLKYGNKIEVVSEMLNLALIRLDKLVVSKDLSES